MEFIPITPKMQEILDKIQNEVESVWGKYCFSENFTTNSFAESHRCYVIDAMNNVADELMTTRDFNVDVCNGDEPNMAKVNITTNNPILGKWLERMKRS